jgi:exosome complex exonuclease DIS3/RRP44
MAPALLDDDSLNSEEEEEDDELTSSIQRAPVLYTRPVHFRQVRRKGGQPKVYKAVQERYLREDLGYGNIFVSSSESQPRNSQVATVVGKPQTLKTLTALQEALRSDTPQVVVCDANVLLHNLDALEAAVTGDALHNIVIPQTALEECRANRWHVYERVVRLLQSVSASTTKQSSCLIYFPDVHHVATARVEDDEIQQSANDRNDARIRQTCAYLGEALRDTLFQVVLLTDDAASRVIATEEDAQLYQATSVRRFMQKLDQRLPDLHLADLVAQFGAVGGAVMPSLTSQTPATEFAPHVAAADLTQGLAQNKFIRGVFRASRRGDAAAGVVTIRRGGERVAVTLRTPVDANRAVDGDVVALALYPARQWLTSTTATIYPSAATGIAADTAEPTAAELENLPEARPTGKVVGIFRRNFGSYSGSIFSAAATGWRATIVEQYEGVHADGSHTVVLFPVDDKIPPILFRTTRRERLLGQRILVSLDSWPTESAYPVGHYIRTMGPAGSKDVETAVLLEEHKIPHEEFSAAVLACLPPDDYKIVKEKGRTDLRHLPVLSIDPPNCKDIDDALHCISLDNGNYQIGVHIADVTHYVQSGMAIDLEAANRSTSTYLVNKRLDMLPKLLTTDLCSLKGYVDRFAFSVLWEVSPKAEIVNVDFCKTIIHSVGALTYQQAQDFIEQPDDPNDVQACAVKRLAMLSRMFRKRRMDAGALTLASPEVKFVLDAESLNPTDVQAYAVMEANAVVEEFMLLANVTVSKKILRHYPTLSVLRRHPAPNRAMFDSLISKANCKGLTIDIDDSKRLADSLDAAQVPDDPYINKLLRILSTRCMSPAQYFCSGEFRPQEWHHYGLAAPVYTHFTSPIRRYPDVIVHRLLAAAIGVAPLPPQLSSKSYLHDLCANMNRRHRSAQLAGRSSVQLHTLLFFAGGDAKHEMGYVLDVETASSSEPSCAVFVPRYGIEGRVKLPIRADDPQLARYPEEHKLVYKDSVSIQVFDKVTVAIWVKESEDHHRELVIDLVDPIFVEEQESKSEVRPKKRTRSK